MRTTELRTPNRLIDRPSLRRTLDDVLTKRLALIIAPAGAGKTTLVSQWAAGRPDVEVAFVDLGEVDEGPSALVSALASALATPRPPGAELETDPVDSDPATPALLARSVAAHTDVVVVLDDLQDFMTLELAEALGELIGRLPRTVHLILSTRTEPLLRLSRLRLEGDVLELRQADLVMSDEEALEVLEGVVAHPVDIDGVQAFLDRAEGWAAGIQLAALELQHQDDPDDFLAEFSGNDRLVADYLWEEVFRVLPGELQDLLLSVSVLDVMSADVVDEVTGCGIGTALHLFETMERESLFLVPLDSHREWYRFHHLFLDLLRHRFRLEHEEMAPVLLRRAAEWYLIRQEIPPAVEYLVRARDWERTAELIRVHRPDLEVLGQGEMVRRWLQQIPEPVRVAVEGDSPLHGSVISVETTARFTEVQRAGTVLTGAPGREAGTPHEVRAAEVRAHPGTDRLGFSAAGVSVGIVEDARLMSRASAHAAVTIGGGFDGPFQRTEVVEPGGYGRRLPAVPPVPPVEGPSDPLTYRERELLAYLPTRLTNPEIAKRLYVSINTVKTHMAHIYRKLGATSRDTAIERAREMGLI